MDENGVVGTTTNVPGIMGRVMEMREEVPMQVAAHPLQPATRFDLTPKSLDEAMRLAEMMASSTMVPKDFVGKPGNIIVAMQWGFEIGLKPMQSVQNIAVINGRPSLWGDAALAIVRASPICDYVKEPEPTDHEGVCIAKRRGEAEVIRRFTWADAERAGLSGKDTYKGYRRRMLQLRARAWALRDVFTDVLRGMAITEEVMDFAISKEKDVTPAGEPIVASQGAPSASKSDKLKERLKPSGQAPSIKEVLDKLNAASNVDQLADAADFARGLVREEDKTAANQCYKRIKAKILGEPEQRPSETLESGGAATSTSAE